MTIAVDHILVDPPIEVSVCVPEVQVVLPPLIIFKSSALVIVAILLCVFGLLK